MGIFEHVIDPLWWKIISTFADNRVQSSQRTREAFTQQGWMNWSAIPNQLIAKLNWLQIKHPGYVDELHCINPLRPSLKASKHNLKDFVESTS